MRRETDGELQGRTKEEERVHRNIVKWVNLNERLASQSSLRMVIFSTHFQHLVEMLMDNRLEIVDLLHIADSIQGTDRDTLVRLLTPYIPSITCRESASM